MSAALDAYAAGHSGEHAVLVALAACRLLVPVVARAASQERAPAGPAGLRQEKASEMALPTLIGNDGRAALPAFTSVDSLARWRTDARPVPVPAAGVWRSGAQDASAVVIDVAGPVPFAVDGARLAALAEGRPPPMPHEDPDVVALVRDVLAGEPAIAGVELRPGRHGTDLTLCLVLRPAAVVAQARAQDAVERVSASVMMCAGDRVRRGIEVAVRQAGGSESPAADAGTGGAAGAGAAGAGGGL